jgi:hypothetical protein
VTRSCLFSGPMGDAKAGVGFSWIWVSVTVNKYRSAFIPTIQRHAI